MSGLLLPDLPGGRDGAGAEESGRQRRKVKPARELTGRCGQVAEPHTLRTP